MTTTNHESTHEGTTKAQKSGATVNTLAEALREGAVEALGERVEELTQKVQELTKRLAQREQRIEELNADLRALETADQTIKRVLERGHQVIASREAREVQH